MSNTPNNPLDPQQPKGPWVYSGISQPTPTYSPPSPTPVQPPSPTPAPPLAAPAPAAAAPENPAATPTPAGAAAATSTWTPARPAGEAKSDDASLASIIDTIEAIIIALILALTFRAFIVEAFVIPTGSMAPTLLGAHFNAICSNCGYHFHRDANLHFQRFEKDGKLFIGAVKEPAELASNRTVPCDGEPMAALICPNCQHVVPYEELPQFLGRTLCNDPRTGERYVPFAWANNGDRILVLKYIYSVFEPKRWDVIVFKEPMHARDNYIKRLIGLPGETVEIINGDIFATPPGIDPDDLKKRTIQRKPPHIQRNLWQLVYDNDYYPHPDKERIKPQIENTPRAELLQKWHNPWKPRGAATGWTIDGPVVNYKKDQPGTLEFVPRDVYTFNVLGYNNDVLDLRADSYSLSPVGDLHLETTWTPSSESSTSITMTLGAKRNRFRVAWSRTGLVLERLDWKQNKWETVNPGAVASATLPQAGQTYHVEMNNVDHAVQFIVNGKMLLEHVTAWTAFDARNEYEELKSALEGDPGEKRAAMEIAVSIEVAGQCTLGHLKLMRDLFYAEARPDSPRTANRDHPLRLSDDEFFALGDNSRKSHDGRSWGTLSSNDFPYVYPALDDLGTTRGVVPRRYLLGKAFFVYWPAGHRMTKLQSFDVPLVPNTGEMRFIR